MGWGDVTIFCSSKCWYNMDYGQKKSWRPLQWDYSKVKTQELRSKQTWCKWLYTQKSRLKILTNMMQVIAYSCKQHETFQLDCILNTNILQIAEKDTHGRQLWELTKITTMLLKAACYIIFLVFSKFCLLLWHGIFYLMKTSRYIFTVINLSFLIALKKLHVYCGSSINITQKLHVYCGSSINISQKLHVYCGSSINITQKLHVYCGSSINITQKLHVYCGSSINITQKLRLNIYIILLYLILYMI